MKGFISALEGYKTYIGLAVGAAGILCPALGAPLVVCKVAAGLGGLIALYGKVDADKRLSDSVTQGRELAQKVDDMRKSLGKVGG